MRTLGIDISRHPHGFDWSAVHAAGIRFSVCKATEGTALVDPRFEAHLKNAEAAGLLTGSYHAFRAHQDPELQARHYYKTAGERTHLPPAVSLETLGGVAGEDAFARARRFLAVTEALWDRMCTVRTYPAFWYLLGDPNVPEIAERPLWIAHHTRTAPSIPRPWAEADADWTFWQFDGDGGARLPGNIEADFHWFAGDEEDLRNFIRQSMPTIETTP